MEYTAEQKKEYALRKKAELASAYELTDKTAEQLFCTTRTPYELLEFLNVYSTFSSLGLNNALLIYAQYPSAKEIHPVKYWNEHSYSPKKGARAFSLIEKGEEYTRSDGSKAYRRNVVKYFDVSQTTASYRVPDYTKYDTHALIKSLLKITPVKYESYDESSAPDGWNNGDIARYFSEERKIVVEKNLPFVVFFEHYATALAMAFLDRGGDFNKKVDLYHFDAECIAFLLCKKYNIDTSEFYLSDIPEEYMNYDTKRIKDKLFEITDMCKLLNDKMYVALEDVMKEYQAQVEGYTPSKAQVNDYVR